MSKLQKEVWKDIPNYEGMYQVSNLGRVKSLERFVYFNDTGRTVKERILATRLNKSGYSISALCKGNKMEGKAVHRLVMLVFVGDSELEVNHINGVKTDNRLENLEYCTRSENNQHAYDTGLRKANKGEDNGLAKLTTADAERIKYGHKDINQSAIAKMYGVDKALISRIRLGKSWKHI